MGTLDTMNHGGRIATKRLGLAHAAASFVGRPLPTAGLGAAVLCYHDVGTEPNPPEYSVTPGQLRAQLEAVLGWGLRVVELSEIVARLAAGGDLDGLAAVTFDDGLLGVLDAALPVLEDLEIPATVFVVTDLQGVPVPFWPGAARTLTAEELHTLAAAGIRLGSHSCTHASLPDVDDDTLRHELVGSRAAIAELTGAAPEMLAYPFGHQDTRVRCMTAEAGYRAAFTFSFGRVVPGTDPYAIPRFCMGAGHHRARLAYHLARPPQAW